MHRRIYLGVLGGVSTAELSANDSLDMFSLSMSVHFKSVEGVLLMLLLKMNAHGCFGVSLHCFEAPENWNVLKGELTKASVKFWLELQAWTFAAGIDAW